MLIKCINENVTRNDLANGIVKPQLDKIVQSNPSSPYSFDRTGSISFMSVTQLNGLDYQDQYIMNSSFGPHQEYISTDINFQLLKWDTDATPIDFPLPIEEYASWNDFLTMVLLIIYAGLCLVFISVFVALTFKNKGGIAFRTMILVL